MAADAAAAAAAAAAASERAASEVGRRRAVTDLGEPVLPCSLAHGHRRNCA